MGKTFYVYIMTNHGGKNSRNARPPVLSNTGGQLKEEPMADR